MTYLELVNNVLRRLRQDEIDSVVNIEDEAAKIVADFVNDAKTKVDNAWSWNAHRTEWELEMTEGVDTYTLPDSNNYAIIDYTSNDTKGYFIETISTMDMTRKTHGSGTQPNGQPLYMTVTGATPGADVKVKFWPAPKAGQTIKVYGFHTQDDLQADADVLLVPHLPVIYEALALSARERGEVGGQTAMEILELAREYTKDAIALDGALSPIDNIWYQS